LNVGEQTFEPSRRDLFLFEAYMAIYIDEVFVVWGVPSYMQGRIKALYAVHGHPSRAQDALDLFEYLWFLFWRDVTKHIETYHIIEGVISKRQRMKGGNAYGIVPVPARYFDQLGREVYSGYIYAFAAKKGQLTLAAT
jgi:hypothetical protein